MEFGVVRKANYSDFWRVDNSDIFVPIGSADTSDKVPVRIVVGMVLRISNPWVAAYGNDQGWTARVYTTVPSEVNDVTRNLPLDKIIAGNTKEITDRVVELGHPGDVSAGIQPGPLAMYGIVIEQASTPDRSVVPEGEMSSTQKRLAAVALARVDADARGIQAAAEANAVTFMAAAVNGGGDGARLSIETERDVRVAQAAGDKAIIMVGGSNRQDNLLLGGILGALNRGNGNNP